MIDKPPPKLPFYEIRIKGHLDAQWMTWFDGLTITLEENGETLLSGPVADQAALHGLAQKSTRSGNAIGFGCSNPCFGLSSKRFKKRGKMTTSNKLIEVMIHPQPSFRSILYQTIISHTVTYFATGVVAAILLGYATRMIRPDVAPIIRNITDPILMASPLFQPLRAA
jgi:hypothetical protein